MRLFVLALSAAAVLAACDSNSADDTSSFARLQGGTWERTDAGVTDEAIDFRRPQEYAYFEGDAVVDQGKYFTRSSAEGDSVFTIGYLTERPDDDAVLSGDVLTLTAEGRDETRTYRRR